MLYGTEQNKKQIPTVCGQNNWKEKWVFALKLMWI